MWRDKKNGTTQLLNEKKNILNSLAKFLKGNLKLNFISNNI